MKQTKDPYELREIPCKQCGELFTQTRTWQEFCCNKHRSDYHNAITLAILRKAKNGKA